MLNSPRIQLSPGSSFLTIALTLTLLVFSRGLRAEAAGENPGLEVLERVFQFHDSLSELELTMLEVAKIPSLGMGSSEKAAIGLAKPNFASVVWEVDRGVDRPGCDLACDGVRLLETLPEQKVYKLGPAPKQLRDLRAEGATALSERIHVRLLLGLLSGDARAAFEEDFSLASYGGLQGEPARHLLKLTRQGGAESAREFELLVSAGENPWIEGLKRIQPKEGRRSRSSMERSVEFTDWRGLRKGEEGERGGWRTGIDTATPEGWRSVRDLADTSEPEEAPAVAEEPEEPEPPVVTEPDPVKAEQEAAPVKFKKPSVNPIKLPPGVVPPDFDLISLKGKKTRLSKLRGHVVVLDFWATWCGPCVAGLPVVSSVARAYELNGVKFFAVNQNEDPKHVRAFMKKKGWDFEVLLDFKGEAGEAFGISGLPSTLVIDKRGKARSFHVGFAGEEETTKQLAGEILGLLNE